MVVFGYWVERNLYMMERCISLKSFGDYIMKVCVLGLGEVGLPTAKYIVSKGAEVIGYDIKQEAVEKAKTQGIKAFTHWQKIPVSDVYIICVYAGLKKGKPDFSSVFDVCKKISEKQLLISSPKACLVSIESTVTPGLCRKVYDEIFERHVRLVHVPHRYWEGDPIEHGVRQPRIIGAINNESLRTGWDFYNGFLCVPLHKVSSIEIAELCKIAENAYRYVQIAFAEELRTVCSKLALSFNETRRACNTKWNVQVPEARDGIGGHCLPKDTMFFASLTRNAKLTASALLVDEMYRKWIQTSAKVEKSREK
jgi:nucleotide sugar dehydrogenase